MSVQLFKHRPEASVCGRTLQCTQHVCLLYWHSRRASGLLVQMADYIVHPWIQSTFKLTPTPTQVVKLTNLCHLTCFGLNAFVCSAVYNDSCVIWTEYEAAAFCIPASYFGYPQFECLLPKSFSSVSQTLHGTSSYNTR